MNREIKFRAWNKKKKVIVYNGEDGSADYWDGAYGTSIGIVNTCLKEQEYTWMQFTGLQDKNGKDIYEGDILSIPEFYETPEMTNTNYINWEVFFVNGGFNIRRNESHEIDIHEDTLAQSIHYYDGRIEVIGNIHQDKDLLK